MRRGIARFWLTLLVAALWPLNGRGQAGEPEPEEGRLKAHVATLASPEFLGRGAAGKRKAADYLVGQFRKLGLKPLFGDSFEQVIPGRAGELPLGQNVGAMIRGDDPRLRDEWVIVSAHYDHLGRKGGVIYPGADDNASGVAMMLEVARSFVEGNTPPKRSLMFIGFDLEESGLFGSRYFVEHSPAPLKKVALFVTADMIGRSLGGVCQPYVFVVGTEHAPGLRPWVERAARDRPVTLAEIGSDILLLDRSDYGPFRTRKVPFLFFSTGENSTYHTPQDVPETLDYPKLTAISRVIFETVRQAVDAEQVPTWSPATEGTIGEARSLRDVLRILLDHEETLKIGPTKSRIMTNTLRNLDEIVARGTITPEERTSVVRVVRLILFSLF